MVQHVECADPEHKGILDRQIVSDFPLVLNIVSLLITAMLLVPLWIEIGSDSPSNYQQCCARTDCTEDSGTVLLSDMLMIQCVRLVNGKTS